MNVYVRDLTREFARRGIQVDVFTRQQGLCDPHSVSELGQGSRVIHVTAGPTTPLSGPAHLPFLESFTSEVQSLVAEEGLRYDLVHSHYWLSGLVARELKAAWNGLPVVHMFHTLGLMKNRTARSESEREPSVRIEGERQVMAFADRIVASTPAEHAQLQWLYGANPDKIAIIPPGVDVNRFHPMAREEARQRIQVPAADSLILYVGRIEPLKGIDTLLQAIGILRAGCPDDAPCLYLAIIGGDPDDPDRENAEMERLKQMRVELGIEEVVTFLGSREQEALPFYYSAADVVVVPSHYESFGMVALEAMACGTPVIASEVGGLAFLVRDGETGYRVEDQNVSALAGKLSLLLEDLELRERLGQQAANYAQGFAWPHIADRLLALFNEAIRGHPAPAGTSVSRAPM
jgi:D-inositol-3-phosphate glycosyltransferase